ncbi:MAG: efflux RND transporter permease subunit [Fibrobacterota bacterium]
MGPLSRWINRYKWAILILCLIWTGLSIPTLFDLKFSDSHLAFFDPASPQLQEFNTLEDQYGKNNTVLFTVSAKKGDIFTPQGMFILKNIHDSLADISGYKDSYSLRTVPKIESAFAGFTLHPRFDSDTLAPEEIKRHGKELLSNPLLVGKLLSPDGVHAAVNARFDLSDRGAAAVAQDIYDFHRTCEENYPEFDFAVTGGVMIDAAFFTASFSDARRRIPLLFGAVFLILLWFTTSFRAATAMISILLFPSIIALCIARQAGIILTAPSAAFPIIILTAGLADTIHIYVRYSHHLRKKNIPVESLQKAFDDTLLPITVTTITTVAGFLLLWFSSIPPFRDLGLISAAGILLAYIFSLFFFPALILTFFPCNRARQTKKHDIFGTRLGNLIARAPKKSAAITLACTILASLGIFRVEFNDRFSSFFDESYAFRRHTDYITQHLTGLNYLTISLPLSPEEITKDNLFLLDSLEHTWKNRDDVRHISGPATLLRKAQTEISDTEGLPSPAMARRIISAYEQEGDSAVGLPPLFSTDTTHMRIEITVTPLSSRELRTLQQTVRRDLKDTFPHRSALVSSPSLLFANLSRDNLISMLRITAASLGIITLILLGISGSPRTGIISLIPNILPPVAAFGIWGLVFSRAGMGVSLGMAMAIGIIVDDTVHILFAHMRSRKKGLRGGKAIIHTLRHVADAVILTSAILVVGFFFLATSGFEPTAHMGKMTALIIAIALGVDLFLYTALLTKAGK